MGEVWVGVWTPNFPEGLENPATMAPSQEAEGQGFWAWMSKPRLPSYSASLGTYAL